MLATVAVAVMAPCSLVMGLPSAVERVHTVIGRGREFDADQRAAGVVRYPPGIGSALESMLEAVRTARHHGRPGAGGPPR